MSYKPSCLMMIISSICFSETVTGPCSDPVCDSTNYVEIQRELGNDYVGILKKEKRIIEIGGNCIIDTLPEEIGNLVELTRIRFGDGTMKHLPASIGNLAKLQFLDISNNQIEELPPTIGRLVNLKTLRISRNNLRTLPDSIVHIVNLERWLDVSGYQLEIGWNHICSLPPTVEMWVDTMLGVNYVGRGDWKVTQCNDCPNGQVNCGTAIKQSSLTQPACYNPEIPSQLFDLHGKHLKFPVDGGVRSSLPKGCYIIQSGATAPYFRRYVVP